VIFVQNHYFFTQLFSKICGNFISVQVTIEILFDSKPEVLPTGASIPRGFRKTVFLPAKKKGYVYYFPNQKPEKKTFSEYLESSF
jgi:hypothetical protein